MLLPSIVKIHLNFEPTQVISYEAFRPTPLNKKKREKSFVNACARSYKPSCVIN
jgi:hypothetical protein